MSADDEWFEQKGNDACNLLNDKKYEEAEKVFSEMLEKESSLLDAKYNRALCLD